MPLYYIKDWQLLYETNETRKLKALTWWPKPNKHDGLGFRRMVNERDKVALFCAWNLICDIASKTSPRERRGFLERDAKPLDAMDMEIMTGFPSDIFTRALGFFGSSSVGWLCVESAGTPGESAGVPGESPVVQKGREGKDQKGQGAATPPVAVAPMADPLEVPEKLKTQEFMAAWARWQTYRRGMKRVKDWLGLFREQLDYLARFDAATATEMLKQSTRNGWTGIFELKKEGNIYGNNRNADKPNPRNAGVIKGPTDYAAALRRKSAGGDSEVAGQMDSAAPKPPGTPPAGG